MHNGFYRSYTANDFGKKIVRRVCELVSSHDWDWTKVCVWPATARNLQSLPEHTGHADTETS